MSHTWQLPHTSSDEHTHTLLAIQISRLLVWGFAWTPHAAWTVGLLNQTRNPSSQCRRAGGSRQDNSPFVLTARPCGRCGAVPGWPHAAGRRAAIEDGGMAEKARTRKNERREWTQPSSKIKSWVYHSLMLWRLLKLGIHLLSVSALLLLFWRH